MPTLNGARVALLEARRSTELAELVRRLDGEPHAVPAIREVPQLEQVPAFLDSLQDGRFQLMILLTGTGIARLLQEAERLGRLDGTLAALRALKTVCRGPKPAAVLRQNDVPVTIRAEEPHTTTELLAALAPVPLDGRSVALLHYGERNQPLADALRKRRAVLEELCLYEWRLPEDTSALAALVRDLVDGGIDAIAFTSQIQCRHLFAVAETIGLAGQLADALRSRVVVAAIGPVCADALRQHGVTPQVMPSKAKIGFLVNELATYRAVNG